MSLSAFQVETAGTSATTLFGLQPFPYDWTLDALDKVHELAASQGTLAVIHRDNGIPWAEALFDLPFPPSVENEWNDLARRVPKGRETYLALGPLAEDRVSLVAASQGSSIPPALRNARLDDEAVKTAYLNYARRAVQRFHPHFLNLGIEAGELAARSPERWPAFAALYEHVRGQLKREHPELSIGISFGLASLMTGDVSQRVKGLVDDSDFLGLSFYPYMSEFYQKFGAAPLTAPPGQWRDALAWASRYTNKPLAICETAYSSRNVDLPAYNLHLKGSPELQDQYVTDLGQLARRDHYLFVIWAISVDYEALSKKLPPGDASYLLWQNVGFFDSQLQPRPAWEDWKQIIRTSTAITTTTESVGWTMQSSTAALAPTASAKIDLALPPDERLPGAPQGVVASASGSGVVLTWRAPSEGAPRRYAIAGGTTSGRATLPVMLTDDASVMYTIPALPTEAYSFRVYAIGRGGIGPASSDALVTTRNGPTIPGPPTGLEASMNGSHLTLTWFPPAVGAAPSSYQVEFETGPGNRETAIVPAVSQSHTWSVPPGAYWLSVRATNGGSISGPSNGVEIPVVSLGCANAPLAPVLMPVTAVTGQLTFTWLPAAGSVANRFRIEVSGSVGQPPFTTLTTSGPGTSLVWARSRGSLAARVIAENACGSSVPSNAVVFTAQP